MPDKLYGLSEDDLKIVRELVAEHRRITAPKNRTRQNDPDLTTPEVYVAKPPSAGIPAATVAGSVTTPGSAACDIYRLIGDDLVQVQPLSQTVKNIHAVTMPQAFMVIERDKYGSWVCNPPAVIRRKACMINTMMEGAPGSTGSIGYAAYLVNPIGSGVFVRDPGPQIHVFPDSGFRGVAFGSGVGAGPDAGDYDPYDADANGTPVDVEYHSGLRIWYATGSGHVILVGATVNGPPTYTDANVPGWGTIRCRATVGKIFHEFQPGNPYVYMNATSSYYTATNPLHDNQPVLLLWNGNDKNWSAIPVLIPLGCGLMLDPDGTGIILDLDAILADGLEIEDPTAVCKRIRAKIECGLIFEGGAIKLDFDSIVGDYLEAVSIGGGATCKKLSVKTVEKTVVTSAVWDPVACDLAVTTETIRVIDDT